jgi:hypothetical protein
MSQTAVAIYSALAGAALALLGTFLNRLWDRFAKRLSAMRMLRSELKVARDKICVAQDGDLWPAGFRLRSQAWEAHGAELVPELKDATWEELERQVQMIDVTQAWAEEARRGLTPERQAAFRKHLQKAPEELDGGIAILDTAIRYARSRLRRGFGAAIAGLAVLLLGGVLVVSSGSPRSRTAVASDLSNLVPGATHAVCEKNGTLDGAYRCAVEVSPCHGQLEASSSGNSCSGAKTLLFDVASGSGCDYLQRYATLRGRAPPSPPKSAYKTVAEWICKKR